MKFQELSLQKDKSFYETMTNNPQWDPKLLRIAKEIPRDAYSEIITHSLPSS